MTYSSLKIINMFTLRNILRNYKFVESMPRSIYTTPYRSDTGNHINTTYMEIPRYPVEKEQPLEKRKARLIYQSRKRGMLENDLLLSTFAGKYLDRFNEEQTLMYDRLINSPSNDWDIFHWIIEKTQTPKEFDNEIMILLKQHAKNSNRESLRQPQLKY